MICPPSYLRCAQLHCGGKSSACVALTGAPAETRPLGIPEEDDVPLGQAAYDAHQVPLPGILLIEQRLQLVPRFIGDFAYVLGEVASVRLALSCAWLAYHALSSLH